MVQVRQDIDIAKSNFRLPWPLEQGVEQQRPSNVIASNPRSTLTLSLNFYFIARFKCYMVANMISISTAMIVLSDIYNLHLSLQMLMC